MLTKDSTTRESHEFIRWEYQGIYDTYNGDYYDSDGKIYNDIEKCVYKFIKNNILLNFPLVRTKTSRRGIKLEVKY